MDFRFSYWTVHLQEIVPLIFIIHAGGGRLNDVPAQSATGKIHSPLRIDYHGGYTAGRGIENLILAMSPFSGASLYLSIGAPRISGVVSMR